MTPDARAYRAAMLQEIKKIVVVVDGNITQAAMLLGLKPGQLSRFLNGKEETRRWWRRFKDERKKRNARNRKQRWRDRYEARKAERGY